MSDGMMMFDVGWDLEWHGICSDRSHKRMIRAHVSTLPRQGKARLSWATVSRYVHWIRSADVDFHVALSDCGNYTKYDIQCLIVFSVVNTLSCSTLNFNSLIFSVGHKCATTSPITMSLLLLSLLIFFHMLTNTKFVYVTSIYYHS
jgi:hypothetical protein